MEKVMIIGSGIAGLTAAVYCARANLSPLVIDGPEEGGQLTLTTTVENFPGFPDGVQGPGLIEQARKQAEKFGCKFKSGAVSEFNVMENGYEIKVAEDKIQTETVIIATGASARWLGIESEKQYKGKGVTTCATCDGALFRDKEVIVVGGGDSAMEESLFLTKFVRKVTIIHRRDAFRASKIMQDRVLNHENISVKWNSVVEEVLGDGQKVTGVKLKNVKTNAVEDFNCDGVFLAIGHIPNTKFLGIIDLDEKGYVKTDRFMLTNQKGVFACGDVQDYKYRQAITAAGTGCQAALEAERFLSSKE
ncbi:thioredoxin-disulfide reductase [Nanoarchaeota archaeon]